MPRISRLSILLCTAIQFNAYVAWYWLIPGIPTSQFLNRGEIRLSVQKQVVSRTAYVLLFEVTAVGFCMVFWILDALLVDVLSPRWSRQKSVRLLKFQKHLCHYVIKPLTIIVFLTSIYSTISAIDDAGLIESDVANYIYRLFQKLQDEPRSQVHDSPVRYLDVIQRKFKCCGASGIADWLGLSEDLHEQTPTENIDIDPWKTSTEFVPMSCIDPRRSSIASPEMLSDLQLKIKGLAPTDIKEQTPIFRRGCIGPMSQDLRLEMLSFISSVFVVDTALTMCLLVLCCMAYKSKENGSGKETKTHISNAKLLNAIQGTPLLAGTAKLQQIYGRLKAEWLERGVRIGWCLDKNGQQKCEYLRRIYKRNLKRPGQIKTSTFRRILRTYLPLMEAVLYTDGDSRLEVEANDYYGGFLATYIRLLLCALYGYFGAQVLIWAFISEYKAPEEKEVAEELQNTPADPNQRGKLVDDLGYVTGYLVKITFVIAAVISKRFRCFLALLGPTLGLSAGRSFLAAELTNVAVNGPVRGLATNLRSAGTSMSCLMKLTKNITEDANKLLRPGGTSISDEFEDETDDEEDEDDEDEEEEEEEEEDDSNSDVKDKNSTVGDPDSSKSGKPVKYPKLKSLSGFNTYFAKVMRKASKGIQKGAGKFKNITEKVGKELLREVGELGNNTAAPNTTIPTPSKQDDQETDAVNQNVNEDFQRHLEEMDTTEKERMRIRNKRMTETMNSTFQNLNLQQFKAAAITNALSLGAKIDGNMRKRMTEACMAMKSAQTQQCNQAAVTSCYRIQTAASVATRLPIIIGPWCASQVTKGTACPTGKALEHAQTECGNSGFNMGIKDGFGAQFAVAQANLDNIAQSFQMGINYKKITSAASQVKSFAEDSQDAVDQLAYITMDVTRGAFALVALFATLLKLLFIKLLLKTQAYITNYLKDMDFDNVFVEDVCEEIDERRKRRGRMYLLPLKVEERKVLFWRKIGYTGEEMVKSVVDVVKVLVLGIALSMLFMADEYLHGMMQVLDVMTQGDLQLGGTGGETDTAAAAMFIAGDGFAAEILKSILDGVKGLMEVDLTYKLGACAPNVILSSRNVKTSFATLWAILILLALFSGYLLRIRHSITGFFYPSAHMRRQMHLYNTMLANRARQLSTNRNLLVQRTKENRLQAEVRLLGRQSLITELAPKLAKKLKLIKGTCVICHDVQKLGPELYICPVDGCTICRNCQNRISKDPTFCIGCIDRNELTMDATLEQLEVMFRRNSQRKSSVSRD